ncbi:hypothetical protein FCM35_KLT02843 [Carex littledalei]|uniref:Uncharacterized protein n=1 Tax=Carex littledalei TaxID=544730 RepID=A0A833VAV2_9POAL|nr:hypothetical protein FCM35_KLT02843 [Carex littledalei]
MLQRSPDLAPTPQTPPPSAGGDGSNVDRQLYKKLVDMLPLVESLVDRRVNSAYSRRAPMVYTPAPSKSKKADSKGEKAPPSDSSKKQRDLTEITQKVEPDSTSDDNENAKKYREEIVKLREQIDNLQQIILEKDEALRIAQNTVDEMSSIYVTLNELRHRVGEKEALIQSTSSQLNNTKMLLAEKQAALEKLEWELKASNSTIEELEESIGLMEFEISSLMKLFEKLCEDSLAGNEDFAIPSLRVDPVLTGMGNEDEMNTDRMDQEMEAYAAALAAARDNPSDEFLVAAAEARTKFHALVC